MNPTRSLKLPVLGLTCGGGGAASIEKAVRRVPGVSAVYVNPLVEAAFIDYDPARCAPADLCDAVESSGYRVVRPASAGVGGGPAS